MKRDRGVKQNTAQATNVCFNIGYISSPMDVTVFKLR